MVVCQPMALASGNLVCRPRPVCYLNLGAKMCGVFLMNFPVSLVVNAAFTRFAPPDVWVQSAGVLLAWAACVGAGALFFHTVEQPLRRWSARPQSLQRPRVLVGVWLLLATILTAWE